MNSSAATTTVLNSPPSSPRFSRSRSLTRQLTPLPVRTQPLRSANHRIAASSAPCTSPERTRPPPSMPSISLYDVLEVPIGARTDEIKAAYRRLARICHPDVADRASGDAGDDFIKVRDAYSILADPDKRADYDRKLPRRRIDSIRSGLTAVETTSFRPYQSRNWETDQCW